jgi:hypothetical protein
MIHRFLAPARAELEEAVDYAAAGLPVSCTESSTRSGRTTS